MHLREITESVLHYPDRLLRASDPRHVARVVLFVVTQPSDINIADITERPPKALNMAH